MTHENKRMSGETCIVDFKRIVGRPNNNCLHQARIACAHFFLNPRYSLLIELSTMLNGKKLKKIISKKVAQLEKCSAFFLFSFAMLLPVDIPAGGRGVAEDGEANSSGILHLLRLGVVLACRRQKLLEEGLEEQRVTNHNHRALALKSSSDQGKKEEKKGERENQRLGGQRKIVDGVKKKRRKRGGTKEGRG